ncbi:MAG: HAMP domain-containing sensor histidine kinase [Nibricoccus sp.]
MADITHGLLTSISHDLGTPLSAILLWTKVLSEQDEVPPQELRDGLQAIRECVEEQLAIIEDIVDTSRIATGRVVLKPERVDFAEVLSGVIENFKQLADDMALKLHGDLDPEVGIVLADPRRLKQVAGSMVGNAIARSPRGATVGVSCVRRGNNVEISVSDAGDGIGGEAIQKALSHFPAKHSPPSKGTTLYTAAKLARLLGGQLDIRSDEGKAGARCTLTLILPVVAREGESVEEEEARQSMTPQKLISYLSSQTEHISAKA